MTTLELFQLYDNGDRDFSEIDLKGMILEGMDISKVILPKETGTSDAAKACRDRSWMVYTREEALVRIFYRYSEDSWYVDSGGQDRVVGWAYERHLRLATAKDIMELSE